MLLLVLLLPLNRPMKNYYVCQYIVTLSLKMLMYAQYTSLFRPIYQRWAPRRARDVFHQPVSRLLLTRNAGLHLAIVCGSHAIWRVALVCELSEFTCKPEYLSL